MPRKKKTEPSPARHVPHEDLVRKSISNGLLMTANMLELQARSLESLRTLDQCRAISGKQHVYLEEAQQAVERAQKICAHIGKRNA